MAKTYMWLVNDARLKGVSGDEYYQAIAESDDHTKQYSVEWDILDDFDPATDDDEGNACDWDNPRSIMDLQTNTYLDVENCVCYY